MILTKEEAMKLYQMLANDPLADRRKLLENLLKAHGVGDLLKETK